MVEVGVEIEVGVGVEIEVEVGVGVEIEVGVVVEVEVVVVVGVEVVVEVEIGVKVVVVVVVGVGVGVGVMEWRETDPRELIDGRALIVICNWHHSWMAHVDTKRSYSVWPITSAPGHGQALLADDNWPDHWRWIRAPGRS